MTTISSKIKFLLIFLITAVTSACFEESVIVKVDKNGSGVVEHHSYNNVDDMMGAMLSGLGDAKQDTSNKTEYNDAYFADKAKKMGLGVTVKDWQLASNAQGFKGYKAIYSFTDVNTLSVSTSPVGDQAKNESAAVDGSALEAEHYFTMKDGRLVIHTPEPETKENQTEMAEQVNVNQAASQQMLAMMGNMFNGARVRIQIEALDSIKDTNAYHREGDRITVMDVRVDELMKDPKLFTEAQKFNALNRADAQLLANKIDGLDVDTQAEIFIQF